MHIRLYTLIALMAFMPITVSAEVAVPADVPTEYRALYAELASRLSAFERRLGNPTPRKVIAATKIGRAHV